MHAKPRKARGALTHTELLGLSGWGALALLASALVVIWMFDSEADANCASRSIRTQVRAEIARQPGASVFELAAGMHHSVAMTLDALPEARRIGVQGAQMGAVWTSLQTWPHAVLFLAKGGQRFRVHAPLSAVHPDSRGGTVWLGGPHDALQGRLQLNEIGSIYAWIAGEGRRLSPAVLFLDRAGGVLFVVAPGNVFEQPLEAIPAEFDRTVQLMRRLQPACAR